MASLARYLDPALIQQVSRLDLRARFIVEGFLAGLHRSPFQGLSVEFSEHRKYAQGDDLRQIDWNVFARTDRLYIRKFTAETHLDCHVLLDASASMGRVGVVGETSDSGSEPSDKLLYAIHLSAALGYLVTRQQDAIGLAVLGERLRTLLPPRARRSDLLHLLGTLAAVRPEGRLSLGTSVAEALTQAPHRGVIVLLSDLLVEPEELRSALHQIRFRGHDLIVMHILDAAEVRFPFTGTLRLEDPESGQWLETEAEVMQRAYVDAVAEWRESLRSEISAMRADYVALDTSVPFDKALVEFLVQRSRRR